MGMLLDISEPFDRHIFPSSTAENKGFLYCILVKGEDLKYVYAYDMAVGKIYINFGNL